MKGYIKVFLFLFLFSFCLNQNVENVEIQESYNIMLRRMQEESQSDAISQLQNQIIVWSCIGLAFILYFSVVSLINMPIQKSSILYAKYGTNKVQQTQ